MANGGAAGMKLSTNQLINLGFALAIFLLVAVGSLAFTSTQRYIASVDERRETHERIGLISSFLSTIKDAETGQRGFLLCHDVGQNELYKASVARWPAELQKLEQRLGDDPRTASDIRQIRRLSTAKLAELKRTIDLRLENQPEAEAELQRLLTGGEGTQLMNDLREIFASVRVEEEEHFNDIVGQVEDSARRTLFAVALICPLSVLMVGLAALVINQELQKRQQANDEIRQQKVVLTAVLDSLNEGVIVIDQHGKLVHFNPAAQRMHGGIGASDSDKQDWSRDYGLFLPDKITPYPPDELPSVRALRGERVAYCELYQRLPGELQGRMFSNTAAPIIDEAGKHQGGVVVVVDITESRAAEDRLRHSEQAFRDLYDHAPCGYYSIDGDYRIVSMNATALSWLGYSADEVIGKLTLPELLAPEDRGPFQERFARLLEQDFANDIVQFYQRRDGSTFPALLSAIAIRDADGKFLHKRTSILDLSHRRAAEQRFEKLIESAPDAMVIVNDAGEIVLVNSQAERLFGYTRMELLGRTVEMVIPERFRDPHVEHRASYFAAPRVRAMGAGDDLLARRADGTEFPIEVSLSLVQSQPEAWVCAVVRDVTDQRALTLRLRQWNEELETRVESRTRELATANQELSHRNQENEMFVYSVSHDLRSPLVNLQGFSQELTTSCEQLRSICQTSDAPPAMRASVEAIIGTDIQESLHFIRNAVQRLSGIIDAMLRLSRAGRIEYECQQLDTQKIARSVVDALQTTIQERKATLRVLPLPGAWGDAVAIEQVFANLVANALNYLEPQRPGQIEVGASDDGDASCRTFYVRDNGVGIPIELQAKIFAAFQRMSPKLAAGEGMGLTLVQRIVERHGGRIWVESTVNVGSTFYFTLPAWADSGALHAEATLAGANHDG